MVKLKLVSFAFKLLGRFSGAATRWLVHKKLI